MKKIIKKLLIGLAIVVILTIFYGMNPIFGFPVCDFNKYNFEFINIEGSGIEIISLDVDIKDKKVSVFLKETMESDKIFISKGKVYENNKLKEEIEINRKMKEMDKKYVEEVEAWKYDIHNISEIRINSKISVEIYFLKNGEKYFIRKNYVYEKNPFYLCRLYYPIN